MEALIKIHNLTRTYNGRTAVDHIDFELNAGEILGFLGPNGAGKSTTMQMLCGTLAPSSGSIEICGLDLETNPLAAKACLGYLPETPPLYPELSVDEFLIYSAQLRAMDKSNIAAAVDRVKQHCGLAQKGRQLIRTLSKGYQQRLGIAQAIIHNPKVIVLDEPTSGLDPNQIQQIQQLIKNLAAEDRGILISTHILPEVEAICDRVQILHQGKLVYSAPVQSGQQQQLLQVEFEHPPEVRQLLQLAEVQQAQQLELSQRFEVQLQETASTADFASAAMNQGWRLSLLQPSRPSLEQTFFRLTQGDVA